ncbi:MAG TPA: UbiA family prenyltransferase [Candidatus Saccharimonadales bacterium]|nr:UbiA family prenyltransferase [Candidatus Saccharimonadales bacterium]
MVKKHTLSVKEVLLMSRPFWWAATVAPFIVGYVVTKPGWNWGLGIGIVYFAICYNLLLYGVHDVYDSNGQRSPKGAKLTSQKHVWLLATATLVNMPFWAYFMYTGNGWAVTWFALMLFMVVTYSAPRFKFKERPVLDSLVSAFHYTSPFIFGVLLAGGIDLWLPAWLAFYLWATANHALGAIQNIGPDLRAGAASIASRFGAERTLVFCLSTYVVSSILPVVYYGWRGVPATVMLWWYVALTVTLLPFRFHDQHAMFHRAWRVLGYLHYICGGLIVGYIFLLYSVS